MNSIRFIALCISILVCFSSFSREVQTVVFDQNGKVSGWYSTKEQLYQEKPNLFDCFVLQEKFCKKKNDKIILVVEAEEKGNYFVQFNSSEIYNKPGKKLTQNDSIIHLKILENDEIKGLYYYHEFEIEDSDIDHYSSFFLNYSLFKNVGNETLVIEDVKKLIKGEITQAHVVDNSAYKSALMNELRKSESLWGFLICAKQLKEKKAEFEQKEWHSEVEIKAYEKNKLYYENKVKFFKNHFDTYSKGENMSWLSPIADSILFWNRKLNDLNQDFNKEKLEAKFELELLEKKKKSLEKDLNKVITAFSKSELSKYPLKSEIKVLHKGCVKWNAKDVFPVICQHESAIVFDSLYTNTLSILNQNDSYLKGEKVYPVLVNISSSYYENANIHFKANWNYDDTAQESDFADGGDVLGLEKMFDIPESFNIAEDGVLPNINYQSIYQSGDKTRSDITLAMRGVPTDSSESSNSDPKEKIFNLYWSSDNKVLKTSYKVFGLKNEDSRTRELLLVAYINDSRYDIATFEGTFSRNDDKFVAENSKLWFELIEKIDKKLLSGTELKSFKSMVPDNVKAFRWFDKDLDKYINDKKKPIKEIVEGAIEEHLNIKDLKSQKYKISYDSTFYDLIIDEVEEPKANTYPKLTVKGQNTIIPNRELTYKVEKDKIESSDLKITINKNATLMSENLSGVRKHYRFSLGMGLLITQQKAYNYNVFSSGQVGAPAFIEEEVSTAPQIRPSFFIAYHFSRYDVFQKVTRFNWYKRFQLAVGLDYRDKSLLDNFYLGLGWSPHKLVHFTGGLRFGQIDRLDMGKVNLYEPTQEHLNGLMEPEWQKPSYYFGVNLGLELIPNTLSLLFN
jgi:hypothetical protein